MPSAAFACEFQPTDLWSRLLLHGARALPNVLGRKSAFRKFCRRNSGTPYFVQTKHGFHFAGKIGDSVDNQIAVWKVFESPLSAYIAAHAHQWQTAIDLGCNVGYFSCLLKHVNPSLELIAIDANQEMIDHCKQNLHLNGHSAIFENCAIGSQPGRMAFTIPENRHSLGTLGMIQRRLGATAKQVEVSVRLLDDVIDGRYEQIDFLKVDIEGYEAEVFRSFPERLVSTIKTIAFEYSEENLRNCGFAASRFHDIPWLSRFHLSVLEPTTGQFVPLESMAHIDTPEATILATNKTLPLAAG